MTEEERDNLILVVAGTALRAETRDRPLAYKIRDELQHRLPPETDYNCVVVSDVWYLNNSSAHKLPTISVGGPGVNHLSSYLYNRLPTRLAVENVMLIQLDPEGVDLRCCVWGMDHDMTVEAVETFLQKGHLDRFISVVQAEPQ